MHFVTTLGPQHTAPYICLYGWYWKQKQIRDNTSLLTPFFHQLRMCRFEESDYFRGAVFIQLD